MHLPKEGMGLGERLWKQQRFGNTSEMALPQQESSKINALLVESHRPPSIELNGFPLGGRI